MCFELVSGFFTDMLSASNSVDANNAELVLKYKKIEVSECILGL